MRKKSNEKIFFIKNFIESCGKISDAGMERICQSLKGLGCLRNVYINFLRQVFW